MIAYTHTNLRNRIVLQSMKRWLTRGLISAEQAKKIHKEHPVTLYSPNVFIRIGLFLFTCFCISSAFGLFMFWFSMASGPSEEFFGWSMIFFGVLSAFALKYGLTRIIKEKELFNSGINEAILYSTIGYFFSGLMLLLNRAMNDEDAFLLGCIILLPVFIAATIRYLDMIMSIGANLCFYISAFLLLIKTGDSSRYIIPFTFMGISAVFLYFLFRMRKTERFVFWKNCITVAGLFNLLVLYFSGNYFVIRESSIELFGMDPASEVPLAFFFWIFTFLVPVAYIYFGLIKKDKVLLWSGLILVGISVMTFRNYYSVAPPEVALSIAGAVLIFLAWFCIRYFKEGRKGITYVSEPDEDNFLKEHAEALIIAQTMTQSTGPKTDQSVGPGGGDFGGGGAETKF